MERQRSKNAAKYNPLSVATLEDIQEPSFSHQHKFLDTQAPVTSFSLHHQNPDTKTMGGFDTLLEAHVGTFGRFQIAFLLYLIAPGILLSTNIMEIVFATRELTFRCSVQDEQTFSVRLNLSGLVLDSASVEGVAQLPDPCFTYSRGNMSLPLLTHLNTTLGTNEANNTHPWTPSASETLSQVTVALFDEPTDRTEPGKKMEDTNRTSGSQRCMSWEYDELYKDQTLQSTFGLVCERAWLVSLSKSVQLFGQLCGSFFGGALADRLGRKPVASAALLVSVAVRGLMALSPVLEVYLVTRFLSGASDLLFTTTAYVLVTESLCHRWRGLPIAFYALGYAMGSMISPLVGYLLPKWSYMALANTVGTALICLPIFLLPESPRWLFCVGRVEQGQKVLQWMARFSRYKVPMETSYCIEMESEEEKGPGVLFYMKSPLVLFRLLICVYLWFTVSMLYFGLALNIGGLAGSIYINAVIMGFIDLPGSLFIQPLVNSRLGRRFLISITFAVCSITLLANIAFPQESIARTVLAMVGKCALLFIFGGLYIITPELFPTGMRSASLGISSGMARLGSAISPFIALCPGNVPAIVFGAAAIIATIAVLALPETRGKPLPTSVSDMHKQRSLLSGCARK